MYFRQDGKWRIAHTHWSYVKHKLPESVEVPIPVQLLRKEYEGVLGEVMALESTAMERWRKGDPWGFTEISAPDVTYFDTGTLQRLNGLDALRAEYAKRKGKIHYDVMELIAPRVQVHGDAAVLTYRFFSTQLNPEVPFRVEHPGTAARSLCESKANGESSTPTGRTSKARGCDLSTFAVCHCCIQVVRGVLPVTARGGRPGR